MNRRGRSAFNFFLSLNDPQVSVPQQQHVVIVIGFSLRGDIGIRTVCVLIAVVTIAVIIPSFSCGIGRFSIISWLSSQRQLTRMQKCRYYALEGQYRSLGQGRTVTPRKAFNCLRIIVGWAQLWLFSAFGVNL